MLFILGFLLNFYSILPMVMVKDLYKKIVNDRNNALGKVISHATEFKLPNDVTRLVAEYSNKCKYMPHSLPADVLEQFKIHDCFFRIILPNGNVLYTVKSELNKERRFVLYNVKTNKLSSLKAPVYYNYQVISPYIVNNRIIIAARQVDKWFIYSVDIDLQDFKALHEVPGLPNENLDLLFHPSNDWIIFEVNDDLLMWDVKKQILKNINWLKEKQFYDEKKSYLDFFMSNGQSVCIMQEGNKSVLKIFNIDWQNVEKQELTIVDSIQLPLHHYFPISCSKDSRSIVLSYENVSFVYTRNELNKFVFSFKIDESYGRFCSNNLVFVAEKNAIFDLQGRKVEKLTGHGYLIDYHNNEFFIRDLSCLHKPVPIITEQEFKKIKEMEAQIPKNN